jgi:hypothetical protein
MEGGGYEGRGGQLPESQALPMGATGRDRSPDIGTLDCVP